MSFEFGSKRGILKLIESAEGRKSKKKEQKKGKTSMLQKVMAMFRAKGLSATSESGKLIDI